MKLVWVLLLLGMIGCSVPIAHYDCFSKSDGSVYCKDKSGRMFRLRWERFEVVK